MLNKGQQAKKVSTKMLRIYLIGSIVFFMIGAILLLYPPHPRSWRKLQSGMTRTEVLGIVDTSTLDLINRDLNSSVSPQEKWARNYWTGQWTLRCVYFHKDNTLRLVTVEYKSSVFPWISRLRHYH